MDSSVSPLPVGMSSKAAFIAALMKLFGTASWTHHIGRHRKRRVNKGCGIISQTVVFERERGRFQSRPSSPTVIAISDRILSPVDASNGVHSNRTSYCGSLLLAATQLVEGLIGMIIEPNHRKKLLDALPDLRPT
jgi:hypothetical protein